MVRKNAPASQSIAGLSPIEIANLLVSQKRVGARTNARLGRLHDHTASWACQHMGLLKLPLEVQEMVDENRLGFGSAVCLFPLSAEKQLELARRIVREGLKKERVRVLVCIEQGNVWRELITRPVERITSVAADVSSSIGKALTTLTAIERRRESQRVRLQVEKILHELSLLRQQLKRAER